MKSITSKILEEMVKYDQKVRVSIRDKYGSKRNVKHRHFYDELKGASLQRKKIVKLLIKNNCLKSVDDYWNSAVILMMGSSKKDFFMSEYCLEKSAKLKGEKRRTFEDFLPKYFEVRKWDKRNVIKEYKDWVKKVKF